MFYRLVVSDEIADLKKYLSMFQKQTSHPFRLVKDKDSIPALIDGRWDEEIQLRKAIESLSGKK